MRESMPNPHEAEFTAKYEEGAEEIRKGYDQLRVNAAVEGKAIDEAKLQAEENKALEELRKKIEDWEDVNEITGINKAA